MITYPTNICSLSNTNSDKAQNPDFGHYILALFSTFYVVCYIKF